MHSYHDTSKNISIEIASIGVLVSITVTNLTRDLHAEDIEHIFERFWRKDLARSDMHHSGLGLSLVKSLCDVLNIKISAQLDSKHILSIRLSNIGTTSVD